MVTRKKMSKTVQSILQATDLREFKKANDAIGLRVVEGSLTLLSRKIFNVMMFHAQEMKFPGVNAPLDTPAAKKYFWIPLADLARNAAYDSKDVDYLKHVLQEMQNIKLVLENDRQWTSERLVSSVTIVNPAGLNQRSSGQLWFGYAFPPEVHEQVMAPNNYTRLSIIYQSSLKSGAALALYEICRRYATNPSKLTFIQSVEYWYGAITGNPPSDDGLTPYKYFKRDTLKPAISEVNKLTDITVELIEHKNGRRIVQLQFRVNFAEQAQLEFPTPPVIDVELMEKIMAFGINQADAGNMMALHNDEVIRTAIARVGGRINAPGLSRLTSTAGYFKWALNDLVKNPSPPTLPNQKSSSKKVNPPSVMEKFAVARSQEALEVYKELDDEERSNLFGEFKLQNHNKTINFDRGIDSALVKNVFAQWYATQLWGDPTAEALAGFLEKIS